MIGELANVEVGAKPRTKKNTILEKLILPRFTDALLDWHVFETTELTQKYFTCVRDASEVCDQ